MDKETILVRWTEPWSLKARGIRPPSTIVFSTLAFFLVSSVLFGVVSLFNHRPLSWNFPGILFALAGLAGSTFLFAIGMSLLVLGSLCFCREVSLYGNGDIVREDSETPSRHSLREADSVTLCPLNPLRTIWYLEVASHPFLELPDLKARQMEQLDRIGIPNESTAALMLQHLRELGIDVQCAEPPVYPTAPATVTCRIAYEVEREPTTFSRFMDGTLEISEVGVTISGPVPMSLPYKDIRRLSFMGDGLPQFFIVLDSFPRVYILPVRWTLLGFFRYRPELQVDTNVYSALRSRIGGPGLCAKCQKLVADDNRPCDCGTSWVEPRLRPHWIIGSRLFRRRGE